MGQEAPHSTIAQLATGRREQLRRFLVPRVRNASDVPDIIQEIYLRLLRVPRQHTIRAPEACIHTVARHVLQQYSLKQAAHQGTRSLEDVLAEVSMCEESDPMQEAAAQECLETLGQALAKMPPKVQATFLLVRRDGLSMEEISRRLGISVPMAKKYLVKALAGFRRHLAAKRGDVR